MSHRFFTHSRVLTPAAKNIIRLVALLLLLGAILGPLTFLAHAQTQPWMDRSLPPGQRASLLVAAMTLDEKIAMVHGGGSAPYVGHVPGNTRLGIPALNLNDGPAGVGNGKTNVTEFPAPITLAATWDASLAQQYGAAMGAEFRGKGVNVALAPMMNMTRVGRAGRNFEGYGEDPYLAALMAAGEVQGLQSNGIIATAKHYINNEQETNRGSENSVVDDRTMHEIYLPPFRASVQAGVGAVMCAYNRVNGPYACEAGPTQNTILKGELGFPGWIMSDWGATHSTNASAINGLDQEMPGSTYFGSALRNAVTGGQVPQSRLDDMVKRILTSMFAAGLFDRPASGDVNANVRTQAHTDLARTVSAQGTVLLKNANNILPLSTTQIRSIAVSGSPASTNPIWQGGGSGSVNVPSSAVRPLDGIRARAGTGVTVSYVQGDNSTTGNTDAANAARTADVAIVFVGVTSSEGSDRSSLSLPSLQNSLVTSVAAANPRTIVVVYAPAQVLLPWANQASGLLMAFLPGEQSGNAIASVLFGDINPSGRLPVTLAVNSGDYGVDVGTGSTVTYSEGLFVGYRRFDQSNITPLYPFGHGLSYTTFGYSNLSISPTTVPASSNVTVGFDLTNTGSRAGAEVAQLYVGFPSAAGEPPKQLKGFQRVMLQPGATQHLTFTLTPLDLSIWDATAKRWVVTPGTYQVMVGASSRNILLTGSFQSGGGTPPVTTPPVTTPPVTTPPVTTPPVTTPPAGDNLALNKPITCTNEQAGNGAANLVDGNTATRWAGSPWPQSCQLDLGATYSLNRTELMPYQNRAYQYRIEVSSDGTTYTRVVDRSTNTTGGATLADSFAAVSGRYVRLVVTGASGYTGGWVSFYELRIFAAGTPPVTTPPVTTPPVTTPPVTTPPPTTQPGQAPYGGTPWPVPGTIQAEDYDTGGEGVAYHDTDSGNLGSSYRFDNVDLQPTTDTGGGYNVGWTAAGEWLEYTVNVTAGGTYTLNARVASLSGGGSMHVEMDGTNVTGAMALPSTGGWQTWTTVMRAGIALTPGQHILRVAIDAAGFNINWVSLTGDTTPPPTTPPPVSNLALGQPVTCSSIENAGLACANAVDGNTGTRWASAFSDPQWITVDLGVARTITRVRLSWEAAFARAYRIEVSDNATTWTQVYSTATADGGVDDLTLSGSGRYVRVYGTTRATAYGYSLWEFEVYGY